MSEKDLEARKEILKSTYESLEDKYEKCKILEWLHKNNSNFRDVDVHQLHVDQASCRLLMTKIQRQLGQHDHKIQEKSAKLTARKHFKQADDDLKDAERIYKDRSLENYLPNGCSKGLADCQKERGLLYQAKEELNQGQRCFEKALETYEELNDQIGVADMNQSLDLLSYHLDKVAFLNSKAKSNIHDDNRERDAVLKAFKVFDTDNSGEMDLAEFAALATELGTYPPLREEELQEAMTQLDNSSDGKISFDELWAWWIAEDIQKALAQCANGRKTR